jgi:hypothetical protein
VLAINHNFTILSPNTHFKEISRCQFLVQGISVNSVVCSNLATILSRFSSVSTHQFQQVSCTEVTFLIRSQMPAVLGTVMPGNLQADFL